LSIGTVEIRMSIAAPPEAHAHAPVLREPVLGEVEVRHHA
jgi:hypothetical protein